nr:SDR family NAD(P)-dependent oxidoreductase [Bordetella sp. 15P40C-2]
MKPHLNAAGRSYVALITGAAGQIGYAIATRLAEDGYRVVLVDRADAVHRCATQLKTAGHQAMSVEIDITDPQAVAGLPAQLGPWWDDLAVLINNAGISPKTQGAKRKVIDMPLDEWQQVLAVNLTGMFLVTRTCLPAIQRQGWGRIVMIASQAARTRTHVPGAHYQATKAGMVAFARVLAAEVAPYGVTVNSVAPGRIRTDMTAAVSDTVNGNLASAIPAGRMGLPQEVAAGVAYLVSPDAAYSTGSILDINGGSFMP